MGEHFGLARRERRLARGAVEHDLRERRIDVALPGTDRPERLGEVGERCVLEDQRVGSGVEDGADDALIRVRRVDGDQRVRRGGPDLLQEIDAREVRHPVVDERDVGLRLLDVGDCGHAVAGAADDIEALALEEVRHGCDERGMVVRDDAAVCAAHCAASPKCRRRLRRAFGPGKRRTAAPGSDSAISSPSGAKVIAPDSMSLRA